MQRNLSAVSDLMTHEGKAASRISPSEELRRSVLSCLLWEREFYEDGESIADRIDRLADKVPVQELAALAVEARTVFHLRHVPLLLLRALIRRAVGRIVSDTICSVIQRPDEMCELLSIYWLGSRKPLSNQMKKGLSRAFQKFTPHQLAKYNRRDKSIKLRDVLFLCHAKPKDEEQAAAWKSLVDGTLASPDTWEVALSSGGDKKETFERLIRENKLGYLALLRNLRTMVDVGCDRDLVKTAILSRRNGADKVLPFRFVAASRAAPSLEKELDIAMLASI
ncbi:MAG: TROVE domain-containing protein, partial [Proteobacteria bacterium]|nr:TROVE domain-containing protein [Pseudomonadota bacterium]